MSRPTLRWFCALALAASAPAVLALEETRCPLRLASLPTVYAQCATLPVPLDPADPHGPGLELFVARVLAPTATPRPDPLVLVSGGPGQSAVDLFLQTQGAFAQVLRDRDVILLDQRGTGRSARGFACAEARELALEAAEPEEVRELSRRCLEALEHDPRLFTTSVAVQDLESLRRALGLEQWNLYGVSYGTRVVQHYLRRFPDAVRAVILDGVVPADLPLGPDIAPRAQAALEALFERCAAAPECGARFADLPARFEALVERIRAAPLEVVAPHPRTAVSERRRLTLAELQAVVRMMSYSAPTAALLPLTIDEAHEQNYQPLAAQALIIVDGLRDALSFPMHNSVVCTEDVPYAGAPPAALEETYLGTSIVDALAAICSHWPAGVIDDDFRAPVESDRPVLLLSGENDPVTPPEYAERARAGGLANAIHLVAPGQGHGMASVGCVPRLMRAFLERPEPETFNGDCLRREPVTPFFLSFGGPAP
jgi:pimeloyl-ACP methyl ester carboxylesterase